MAAAMSLSATTAATTTTTCCRLCTTSALLSHYHHQLLLHRRPFLFLSTATTVTLPPPQPQPLQLESSSPKPPDTTITDRVFMDFTICPNYFRQDRLAGKEYFTACDDGEFLGRVVLGLYGKLVPITAGHFKAMCVGTESPSGSKNIGYKGTIVHKVIPGRYMSGGKQGRKDRGEIEPPLNLERNTETVDSKAFRLRHVRPGTLSLCLSENDDEDDVKLDPEYRNVEFFITTGPGPCPDLDNANIVFGTVLQGLDVITQIAAIPTYKPGERIRQFNDFAEFIGDRRAQIARNIWDRPLKTVFISDCGELKVTTPSLSPSLP